MKQWIIKNRKAVIIITAIFLFLLTSFLTLLILPRRDALVQLREGSYFKARNVLVAGPVALMLADTERFKYRKKVLGHVPSDMNLSIFSLENLRLIEFLETKEDTTPGVIPPYYLGSYKIIAAAHRGYLKLWMRNGRVYGSIRFPNWARGVTEYLKSVSIKGENIRFVRSITTSKEQRRVGANAYFTQVYHGKYYIKGRKIKGYYSRNGHRGLWEAVR